jgi:hypothetical protein
MPGTGKYDFVARYGWGTDSNLDQPGSSRGSTGNNSSLDGKEMPGRRSI